MYGPNGCTCPPRGKSREELEEGVSKLEQEVAELKASAKEAKDG